MSSNIGAILLVMIAIAMVLTIFLFHDFAKVIARREYLRYMLTKMKSML